MNVDIFQKRTTATFYNTINQSLVNYGNNTALHRFSCISSKFYYAHKYIRSAVPENTNLHSAAVFE